MPRVTDSNIISLLEKNRYEVYDIIQVIGTFDAPWANGITLTNYPTDLVINSVTYYSIGGFLNFSTYQQSTSLQVNQMSVTLSGLPQRDNGDASFLNLFLNEEWKDREVVVSKVLVDDPTDDSTIEVVEIFRGFSISSNYISEDGGAATISVTLEDEFTSFENISGRRNNFSEAPEIATKLYSDWPVNPAWQELSDFNKFDTSHTVNAFTNEGQGDTNEFFSPYGYDDSWAFKETADNDLHYIYSNTTTSLAADDLLTFSCYIAPYEYDADLNYTSRRYYQFYVFGTETSTITGPVFDLYDGVLDSAPPGSDYIDYGVGGFDTDGIQTPAFNKYWFFVWFTFKAPESMTNVTCNIITPDGLTGASQGNYTYTGDTDYGFQICNASMYKGAYDYDKSVRLSDYYYYIPDQMFINSAKTNQKIRWVNT